MKKWLRLFLKETIQNPLGTILSLAIFGGIAYFLLHGFWEDSGFDPDWVPASWRT